MTKRAVVARVAAIVGPAAFTAAAAAGAKRVAGYQPADEPISALAARGSEAGPLMVGGFAMLGGSTFALGRALEGTRMPVAVARMMQAAGVLTIGAGLARVSDRSCPTRFLGDDGADALDEVHTVVSAGTFALWIAMPTTAAIVGKELGMSARVRSGVIAAATAALFARTAMAARADDQTGAGAAQRAAVTTALAWFPIAARAAFA